MVLALRWKLLERTIGGDTQVLSWNQVTGNEGYRVEWDTASHTTEETAYANNATKTTNTNSHTIDVVATTTYYWRVAALVDGDIQQWSAEESFVA